MRFFADAQNDRVLVCACYNSNPSVSHKADTSPINMGGFQFCDARPTCHSEMRSIEESHKRTGGIR